MIKAVPYTLTSGSEKFCDYIAQYGIVILKLYTKKTEKGIFIDYKYNGIKKCYIYTQQF